MSEASAVIIAALAALLIGGGGVLWVVKTSVGSIVKQNQALVKSVIDSSDRQTKAIEANTVATRALAGTLDRYIAVGDERDRNTREWLARIERAAIRRQNGDTHGA